MAVFEVHFDDGRSQELVEADYHERVGDDEHFVTNRAGQRESWVVVSGEHVVSVERRDP